MLRALLLLLLAATQRTRALSLSPPPLVDDTRRLSFREVANRASTSVEAAFAAGHRRVSVEVPQMSDAGGTSTARKFEDDNSFLLSLVELLGGGRSPSAVGCKVEIADNWRVSGEYLTEEGLYGYRFPGLSLRLPQGGAVTLLGNSEIGNSALRDLKELDDGRGRLVLFNMQLDRLSFLDKIGMPPVDDVEPAYLLRCSCGAWARVASSRASSPPTSVSGGCRRVRKSRLWCRASPAHSSRRQSMLPCVVGSTLARRARSAISLF